MKKEKKITWEDLNPQPCDTHIPYMDVAVLAGNPTPPGDVTPGECVLLPKHLVNQQMEFVINVDGLSMKDMHILPGDQVRVRMGVDIMDGDVVVAELDGECTIKIYCTDDQGTQWLVPANEEYDALKLQDYTQVRIIGKVVGIMKSTPRASYRECLKSIRRTQNKGQEANAEPWDVEEIIRLIADQVIYARQWYAVCRVMMDNLLIAVGDYRGFVQLVKKSVPQHQHLPVDSELRRMEIYSFARKVTLWDPTNAPVSGQRFDDYKRIALRTQEYINRKK